jgi:hypothetical protein
MKANLLKILISFSALFAAHSSRECGYSPYQEWFRVTCFDSNFLNFEELNAFTLTTDYFNGPVMNEQYQWRQNIDQWYEYCSDKSVRREDIRIALYDNGNADVQTNPFVRFLKENKPEAYTYMRELLLFGDSKDDETADERFRKNWLDFSDPDSYYWGEGGYARSFEFHWPRVEANLNACNDPFIKKRWAYQALVSAFYQDRPEKIKELFGKYFTRENRTWIDNSAQHYFAQVSPNCQELLLECVIHGYDKQFRNIDLINGMSKDNEQWVQALPDTTKSYYYFVKGLREFGRGLPYLKKVYELNRSNRYLDFLINREVNKIEDWLLASQVISTKEYFESYNWEEDEESNLGSDKRYAAEVLSFVRSIKSKSLFRDMVVVYLESLLGKGTSKFNPELYKNEENQYVQARILDFLINFKKKSSTGEYRKDLLYIFENVDKIDRNKIDYYWYYNEEEEFPSRFMRQQVARRLGAFMTGFKEHRIEGFLLSAKSTFPQNDSGPFYGGTPYINLYEHAEPEECVQLAQIIMSDSDDEYWTFLKKDEMNHFKIHYCSSYRGSPKGQYDAIKILDIAAQKYVSRFQYEEALKVYEKFPKEYWESTCEEMPFIVNVHNPRGPVPVTEAGYFNKLAFLKQFIEYKKQLEKNPKDAILNFYVANAYLSMSKLGCLWYIACPYNSIDIYEEERQSQFTKKAVEHYNRLVKFSGDAELKSASLLALHWLGKLNQAELNRNDHALYKEVLWNCDRYQNYLSSATKSFTSVYAWGQEKRILRKFQGFERYNSY